MALSPTIERKVASLGLKQEHVFGLLDQGVLLPLSSIGPNAYNPKTCEDARLLSIAQSLRRKQWQPSQVALVWRDPDGATEYTLIDGEHRWMVCRLSGFTLYPAVVATQVTTREQAAEVTLAFEEARARKDKRKSADLLIQAAVRGDDDFLTQVLRVRDPERLRAAAIQREQAVNAARAQAAEQRASAPRTVTLVMTGAQYDEYQAALGKARTVLARAQETIGMVTDLSDGDVVAVAAVLRNGG